MADEIDIEYSAHKASGMSNDVKYTHLESRVSHLEGDVGEIKGMVKQLVDRPQNPGFAQVIGTLLATLGTCAIIFGFAEWRLREAVAPVDEQLKMFSQMSSENRIKAAVLEERSSWMRSVQGWKPQ